MPNVYWRRVLSSDITPVLGGAVAAVLSLVISVSADLIYFAIDPRIRG